MTTGKRMWPITSAVAVLAVAVAGSGLAVPAQAGTHSLLSPAEIVAELNIERAANGIGPVTHNPEWSAACSQHLNYLDNGGALEGWNAHTEVPGTPGYTEQGAWAGHNSVLAGGGRADMWRYDFDGFTQIDPQPRNGTIANPWITAPAHLAVLMDPQLKVVGAASVPFITCVTTWPGYVYPGDPGYAGDPEVTWFTGPRGASQVATSMVADESPTTPGVSVGIPNGTKTGPYIFLYSHFGAAGSPQHVTGATTLTGPDGQVETLVVDNGFGGAAESADPATAMFIPVKPLRANSDYTLSTTVNSHAVAVQFHTANGSGGGQAIKPLPRKMKRSHRIALPRRTDQGGRIRWKVMSKAVCSIDHARLKARRAGTCKVRAVASEVGNARKLSKTYKITISRR